MRLPFGLGAGVEYFVRLLEITRRADLDESRLHFHQRGDGRVERSAGDGRTAIGEDFGEQAIEARGARVRRFCTGIVGTRRENAIGGMVDAALERPEQMVCEFMADQRFELWSLEALENGAEEHHVRLARHVIE